LNFDGTPITADLIIEPINALNLQSI
jgi:hypothetical protein